MCSLRCKGTGDERRNKDWSSTDPRGDVIINGVKGVEEEVAIIKLSFGFISKRGGRE